MNLILRELQVSDQAAFHLGLQAFQGESTHWFTFDWKPEVPFAQHVQLLQANSRGEDLPSGFVPSSLLYAFVDDIIVGRVSIRHELNNNLRYRGGHIGYSVAPQFRRRGYATEMFRQALIACRQLGLKRLMITCDDNNEASWRLLERAGAKLEEVFFDDKDLSNARRYWLDV